ncbi:MAG: UDP-N-acetylmuramate--L-alanine ligase [Clostridia bacterium]|nr:UDP-N-acetylmuramate--L-alanine ligase [Clostridia bacterium]
MPNIENIKKYKKIHMIGIGGVSMSGIAEILVNWGFEVSGSDRSDSEILHILNDAGIKTFIGHNAENITDADCVVYTAAISLDNPELIRAKELNIPVIERSDFLGELTRCYENTIAVSGTHGKTTTTSLVSLCFMEALQDPSVQVGAIIKELDGNYRVGNSETFIIEACEYVESFLKFSPKSEIILNIDNDHLDYYKNMENIKNAFIKYVKILPEDGHLVINADDPNCLDLPIYSKAPAIKYGIENEDVDFSAKNIVFDENGLPEFDCYKYNEFFGHFKLSIPGKHNILNALSCIALCDAYGIPFESMKIALQKFTGADRRFQFKGMLNGAKVYDDYGHHPTEVSATAKALNNKTFNNSWVVFQPHTYSRTFNHLDEFAEALLAFDNIIITDIYAAREVNTYNISSKDLADAIIKLGKNAKYISSLEECASYLKENVQKDDIVLTLGAGSVTNIGSMIIE